MSDGKGCTCSAYAQHECACDADWTPQEIYDLRQEVALLKGDAKHLHQTIADGTKLILELQGKLAHEKFLRQQAEDYCQEVQDQRDNRVAMINDLLDERKELLPDAERYRYFKAHAERRLSVFRIEASFEIVLDIPAEYDGPADLDVLLDFARAQ